jgi:hypothetical protein
LSLFAGVLQILRLMIARDYSCDRVRFNTATGIFQCDRAVSY